MMVITYIYFWYELRIDRWIESNSNIKDKNFHNRDTRESK